MKEDAPPGKEATDEGVKVPEEFQKQVHAVVSSATSKEMLAYLRECCFSKESEMRKEEDKEEEYSSTDEPAD